MAAKNYLNEKQLKAIDMLMDKEHSIKAIAEELGVARSTLYAWMDNELFKAELDKRTQKIVDQCNFEFQKKAMQAMNEYWKICMGQAKGGDIRARESALKYWMERALGKVTTPVQVDDNRTASDSESDLKEMFAQAVKEKQSGKNYIIPLNFRPDKQAQ